MTLYEITQALIATPGNNDKLAILEANKDNELLKAFFKAMLDPAINYYQTKLPSIPKATSGTGEFGEDDIRWLDKLTQRKVTGNEAKASLAGWVSALNDEGRFLMECIIKRQIPKSKVGDTMALKTWPGLFFIPPYMRCAGMDPKVLDFYRSKTRFYVQPKRDGSFAYLSKTREGAAAITRSGNHYPKWFADHMAQGLPWPVVLIGEMEVYQRGPDGHDGINWNLLDRKTGNGILNSVLSGEDEKEFHEYRFSYVAWDLLSDEEFKSGKSDLNYFDRLAELEQILSDLDVPNIEPIETHEVESVEQAFAIHTGITTAGKEGTVWKTMNGKWKDTSSGTKDAVKCKVEFEADFFIRGFYEGTGKAAGMLGGIEIATKDDLLQCNCGSGFSDDERARLWKEFNAVSPDGLVVEVKANDVITNKNRPGIMALSLPIFSHIRWDKKEADTLARVIEQRDSARMGK